jgi:hypothetical protein
MYYIPLESFIHDVLYIHNRNITSSCHSEWQKWILNNWKFIFEWRILFKIFFFSNKSNNNCWLFIKGEDVTGQNYVELSVQYPIEFTSNIKLNRRKYFRMISKWYKAIFARANWDLSIWQIYWKYFC